VVNAKREIEIASKKVAELEGQIREEKEYLD
jgi:hypothetical protein